MISAIKNLLALKIYIEDFNHVAKKPAFLRKLRKLTLYHDSGMNYELNNLLRIIKTRPVNCKILTAYKGRRLIAWALLSKEESKFDFPRFDEYLPQWGTLFEVFVNPNHRRQGIATTLLKIAKKESGKDKLCVCPHDYSSREFFSKFKDYKSKSL